MNLSRLYAPACLAMGLMFYDCGKDKPKPLPTPVPSPTVVPSPAPTPIVMPAAAPTPTVSLAPYLHQQGGRTMTVVETEGDLGAAINSIGEMLGSEPGKIVVLSGGTIRSRVHINHDFDYHGPIKCDLPDDVEPCIAVGNNVQITAFDGHRVYGPEGMMADGRPAVTVFQADSAPHGMNFKITFKNVIVEGRNARLNDGGYRQAVSLGNCIDCAFIDSQIHKSPGISLQFGGTSNGGFVALRGVVTGSTFTESAAANLAIVNARDMYVWNNTFARPGRVGGPGGVAGVDAETNSADNFAENINIFNNVFDFQYAAFNSVGSAIMAQHNFPTPHDGGLRILNNKILATMPLGGLTSGIFVTGAFSGGIVQGNYIQRAGQPCLQLHGATNMTFQDNDLNTCGGGGLSAILLRGGGGNTFRRNRIRIDEAIGGSASIEITQEDSWGNIFQP